MEMVGDGTQAARWGFCGMPDLLVSPGLSREELPSPGFLGPNQPLLHWGRWGRGEVVIVLSVSQLHPSISLVSSVHAADHSTAAPGLRVFFIKIPERLYVYAGVEYQLQLNSYSLLSSSF